MIKDRYKTKEQLTSELSKLRRRVNYLEKSSRVRRRMEDGLRSVNTIQSLILGNTITGIAFVRDRRFEWANPRMSDMLRLPLKQIHEASTRLMYASDEDYEDAGRRIYQALRKKGEWFEMQLDVSRFDGSIFTGRIIGKALDSSSPHDGSIWILEDITDRKRIEEHLRESEEKYRTVVEKANEGIVIVQDSCFTYVNPKAADIFDAPAAELVGKSFSDFIYPEDRDTVVDRHKQRLAEENVPDSYELRIVSKNNELRWLYLSAKRIQWNGRPATINMFTDITGRKQAEAALRESEAKYRLLVDNSYDLIWTLTADGVTTYVSPSWKRTLGYEPSAVIGDYFQTLVHPDDFAHCHKQFCSAIRMKKQMRGLEYRIRHADGSWRWHAASGTPVSGPDGSFLSFVGISRDITERKKMVNALRKSEERFRSIVETSNVGIIMMTIEGKILFANRQMARILGCDVHELIGSSYNDYVAPEDRDDVASNIRLAKNADFEKLRVQRRYICRDGAERWGYVSVGPLAEAGGRYKVVLTIVDVTLFKQMREEKKQLENHLRQAQKMEAIGTLAGGIAHDFNNILASMMGFTEMAALEGRDDVRQKYHDRVLSACIRAKNLVNQILTFSRRQEQERRPLDIRLILREALSLMRATLPSTIEMTQDIAPDVGMVLADPTQIHQIVMNLCTNAAQAMREKGGVLEIRLSNIEISQSALFRYPDLRAGSYVALSVRDTGYGIDAAIKDKIFDPFFTTKEAREGTGLGLSVVYGIVKSYSGAIDVQSVVGQGTTLTIYLPRISSLNQDRVINSEAVDLSGTERILFVDDEEALVNMTQIFFKSLGYAITATVSSARALGLFEKKPDAFDLVITDMTMPEITGVELARACLKRRPELPIILCTGYSDSINMDQARKLNIREFVYKPYSLNDLGQLIRRVLKS